MAYFILKLNVSWWFPMSYRVELSRRKAVPKMMTFWLFSFVSFGLLHWVKVLGRMKTLSQILGKEDEFNVFILRAPCPEGIHLGSLYRMFFSILLPSPPPTLGASRG